MKLKTDVTAYYIIQNEDKWIKKSIDLTSKFIDNVLVVDTGSEDDSVNLIKDTSAKLISHGKIKIEDFSQVKNYYLKEVITPLVLFIDGNEIISRRGFRWLSHAINTIPLTKSGLTDGCISIPQYEVKGIKEDKRHFYVEYYDRARGRRRLCAKDRVRYRRGFGASVLGNTDGLEVDAVCFSFSCNEVGLFWHLRQLGQSSIDDKLELRKTRNNAALKDWARYPVKTLKVVKRELQ